MSKMTFPSVQFTNTEIQIQIQIQFVLARRTTSSIKLNLLKSDQVKRPLLEEELGKALVKAPCRRHIRDLFGKNLRKVILGRATSGPGHPLFLKFAKEWANIRPNIRGSYRDLLFSIAAFIEAPTPPGFRIKFHKPKPVTNARFGEPVQYYLDIALLSTQIPWLTQEQRQEVKTMSFIAALFYGPGFLQSPLGANAPFNDLQSIVQFRKLRDFMPAVANEALATWERHLDYLTPELVVLGLACEKMPVDQKNAIARELLSLLPNRPVDLPPSRVTYPGPNFAKGDHFFRQKTHCPTWEDSSHYPVF